MSQNNNQRDQAGQTYTSPDNKPATDGTPVTIYPGNGQSQSGTMRDGFAVPNPK
jgi:hypothetical protein